MSTSQVHIGMPPSMPPKGFFTWTPSGTYDAANDTFWFDANTNITITAIPAEGYKFSSWSWTTAKDNPITINSSTWSAYILQGYFEEATVVPPVQSSGNSNLLLIGAGAVGIGAVAFYLFTRKKRKR
jgi:LPXTG-motif cell wall-anchored protein